MRRRHPLREPLAGRRGARGFITSGQLTTDD